MATIFTPYDKTQTISASSSASTSVALSSGGGTGGKHVRVLNAHSAVVFVATGDSTIAATTSSFPIDASAEAILSVRATHTHAAAILSATGSGAPVYVTAGVAEVM